MKLFTKMSKPHGHVSINTKHYESHYKISRPHGQQKRDPSQHPDTTLHIALHHSSESDFISRYPIGIERRKKLSVGIPMKRRVRTRQVL